MQNTRNPFIVVEGLDGTGKTTLRKGLFRLFEGLYRVTPLAVLTTNFLDASVAADLVEGKYQPSADNQYRYLAALAADKQATATRLIAPSLPARPVIADRWLLSELAFFAVKHDRSPKETYPHLAEHLGVIPDLTLVFDISRISRAAPAATVQDGNLVPSRARSWRSSSSQEDREGRRPFPRALVLLGEYPEFHEYARAHFCLLRREG
ncbi:nucleoside/nucleotide kinase family protein [Streptomyces albogriseolus]|uniref:hypothetical protein n=1 Tax=Streptomyces albogriseolus TaxID=1887 RepID=UPI0036FEDDF8